MEKRRLNAADVFPLFLIGISLAVITAEKITTETYIRKHHQMANYTKMVTVWGSKHRCFAACNSEEGCTEVGVQKAGSAVNCYLQIVGSAEMTIEQQNVKMWRKEILTGNAGSECPASFLTTLGNCTGCYYPVLDEADKLPWQQAEDACQDLDPRAHLITLETAEEATEVAQHLLTPAIRVWTGGEDRDGDRTFNWIASPMETVTMETNRWYPGEPGMIDDCVDLYDTGVFVGSYCLTQRPYICEINL